MLNVNMLSVANKPFMLSFFILNVIMLSVIMLSVIMLSVIMLRVIMLRVILLSVIMLNVVVPVKLCVQGIDSRSVGIQSPQFLAPKRPTLKLKNSPKQLFPASLLPPPFN